MNISSLLIILFSAAGINITLLAVLPFLPTMLTHEKLDFFYNGPIIACFSLPYIFSPSLLANHLLPSLGRVNTFLLGSLLLGLSTFLFGVLDIIPSKPAFVIAAILT